MASSISRFSAFRFGDLLRKPDEIPRDFRIRLAQQVFLLDEQSSIFFFHPAQFAQLSFQMRLVGPQCIYHPFRLLVFQLRRQQFLPLFIGLLFAAAKHRIKQARQAQPFQLLDIHLLLLELPFQRIQQPGFHLQAPFHLIQVLLKFVLKPSFLNHPRQPVADI